MSRNLAGRVPGSIEEMTQHSERVLVALQQFDSVHRRFAYDSSAVSCSMRSSVSRFSPSGLNTRSDESP
jgi:hypothetical protein